MAKKKALTDTTKKIIKIAVSFLVIIGVLVGSLAYVSANQAKVSSKLIIACMPKSITGYDNGTKIDFYVEYNKDYNDETDDPIRAFNTYYFDKDGKRHDLPGGRYQSPTQDMQVVVGFFYKAQENIKILKNVIYVIIALVCLAVGVFLIYLWYKSWCKRQEKKKNFYLRDFDKSKD